MQIKLLQLNMWAGTHFPAIQDFLANHDFDILCLQEVTGKNTHCDNVHSLEDQFDKLQNILGTTHNSELAIHQRFTSDLQNSYEANAIFFSKEFSLLKKNEFFLHKGIDPFPSDAISFREMPRNVLHLTLSQDNNIFDVLTTHLAWAPTPIEQSYQRQQNLKLVEYVKTLRNPWILTGDFNISPENQTIVDLDTLGNDLIKQYQAKNTIDEVNHRSWEKIKPGFPVDYIFVSSDIQVNDFKVLNNVHMSDHYGLVAEVAI